MKNITLLLLLLSPSITYCQTGPKIEFSAHDLTLDYGQVSHGAVIEGVFEFENTGDSHLLITGAESTASYIMVNKPSKAIAPGKKGTITIKYNMRPTGPIRKTIIVESNAINYPQGRVGLKIRGEIL